MSSDEGANGQSLKGVIPNFFYDVISFILPGGWLIIGGLWTWYGQVWQSSLHKWLDLQTQPSSASVGSHFTEIPGAASALVLAASLIFLLGFSSLIGFLLSAISHTVFENLWDYFFGKFDKVELGKALGSGSITKLEETLKSEFNFRLENGNLGPASFLCLFYVWCRDPNLGAMTSRIDAERMVSRSCVSVSCLLCCESLICHIRTTGFFSLDSYDLPWLFTLLLCMLASGLAFTYHRKKRLSARFQIFLAIVSSKSPAR